MIETFPWVGDMPEDEYHADVHLPVAALSHSLAHTIITRSPHHARARCGKLSPLEPAQESGTFDRGTAAHAVLLGGDDVLVVVDADDWRSKAAKDARESARAAGLCPILKRHHDDILRMVEIMRDTLFRCPDLAGLDLSGGKAEQSAVWAEGDGDDRILLRMRPDWWNAPDRDVIVDYKTTDGSAHPNSWLRTAISTGADLQDVLYRRGNEATGGAREPLFIFAVQESERPFATSLVALSTAFRRFAEEKLERAIEEWRTCMRTGEWPAYPRRIAYVEPPAWALTQYAERAYGGEPVEEAHGHYADPAILFRKEPA